MKQWVMVLGFVGLMVGAAQASARWSAETCAHLQEVKANATTTVEKATDRRWALLAILTALKVKCGIDTRPDWDAVESAAKKENDAEIAAMRQRPRAAAPAPRQPMHCDTTPRVFGGSTTDCF